MQLPAETAVFEFCNESGIRHKSCYTSVQYNHPMQSSDHLSPHSSSTNQTMERYINVFFLINVTKAAKWFKCVAMLNAANPQERHQQLITRGQK